MKQDKMKKQRTDEASRLRLWLLRVERRQAGRSREGGGGRGVALGFSLLSKLAFMLNALITSF